MHSYSRSRSRRDPRPPPAASARTTLKQQIRRAESLDNLVNQLSCGHSSTYSQACPVASSGSLAGDDSINFTAAPPPYSLPFSSRSSSVHSYGRDSPTRLSRRSSSSSFGCDIVLPAVPIVPNLAIARPSRSRRPTSATSGHRVHRGRSGSRKAGSRSQRSCSGSRQRSENGVQPGHLSRNHVVKPPDPVPYPTLLSAHDRQTAVPSHSPYLNPAMDCPDVVIQADRSLGAHHVDYWPQSYVELPGYGLGHRQGPTPLSAASIPRPSSAYAVPVALNNLSAHPSGATHPSQWQNHREFIRRCTSFEPRSRAECKAGFLQQSIRGTGSRGQFGILPSQTGSAVSASRRGSPNFPRSLPPGAHSCSPLPTRAHDHNYQRHMASQVSAAFTSRAVAQHHAASQPSSSRSVTAKNEQLARLEDQMRIALYTMTENMQSQSARAPSTGVL
jgi:hypothetical protein